MPVTINGSTGITNVDGSAGTPADKGTTSSTAGVFYPAANTVAISTASTERIRVGSSGQIGIAGANYGTSGQVLTSGGASAAPSWADLPASTSLTLLATISTASGTTQAATGLATTYPVLIVVFDAVTPSTSSQISIELSSTNGSAYGSMVGISVGTLNSAASGRLEIWRANASATAHPTSMVGALSSFQYGLTSSNQTSLSTDTASAINAIRFSISAGNFNGGNIYIYGWK